MIPKFPHFSLLSAEHKFDIEKITHIHEPYSDHNFISLWSYNVEEKFMVSSLHNNLIIYMHDYVTKKPIISLMGSEQISDTVKTLLSSSTSFFNITELDLIPETIIQLIDDNDKQNLVIEENRDSFDYILSTEEMMSLKNPKHRAKRTEVHAFIRRYPNHKIQHLNLSSQTVKEQIHEILEKWKTQRGRTDENIWTEFNAIERLIKTSHLFSLYALGIYVEEKLIAFCITEMLPNDHVMAHFAKTDYEYHGITPYLFSVTAKYMKELGGIYWNHQQDLGIPGMRLSKESWLPIKYLKKYTIRKK